MESYSHKGVHGETGTDTLRLVSLSSLAVHWPFAQACLGSQCYLSGVRRNDVFNKWLPLCRRRRHRRRRLAARFKLEIVLILLLLLFCIFLLLSLFLFRQICLMLAANLLLLKLINTHSHTDTNTYATKPGATFFFILNELQVVTLAHTAFIRAFCERACLCLIRMTLSELSFYEV